MVFWNRQGGGNGRVFNPVNLRAMGCAECPEPLPAVVFVELHAVGQPITVDAFFAEVNGWRATLAADAQACAAHPASN